MRDSEGWIQREERRKKEMYTEREGEMEIDR